MRIVPLAGRSDDAVRDALLSHGWEGEACRSAAAGLEPAAFHLTGASGATLEALVRSAGALGLDVVTGPDWAVIAGTWARLGALARPWTVPAPLQPLAAALGPLLPGEEPAHWVTARGPIPLDHPVLIGILNVTPDSFSDAGRWIGMDAAVARAERLIEEGAAILDIGGESTRPGATPVEEVEERRRVVPVIEAILRRVPGAILSVDTVKPGVARDALAAGAAIVNDVSGFRLDPRMAEVCAAGRAGVVLMHSRGTVGDMASLDHAVYPDGVLVAVLEELRSALAVAGRGGVPEERIVVDPGLGFGKTPDQSLAMLRGAGVLRALGRPVLVGPSRKRFLGAVTGRPVDQRDVATAAACALGWAAGARLFRVHQPGPARDALALAAALQPG